MKHVTLSTSLVYVFSSISSTVLRNYFLHPFSLHMPLIVFLIIPTPIPS